MSKTPLDDVVTYFEPPPAPAEVPVRLANPFAHGPPSPLARRAAEELQRNLRRGGLPGGVSLSGLDKPGRGKMFGVLVVEAPDGRIGYLRGFSGMLNEQWHVEGFAPPLFDAATRDAFWPAGEAALRALDERHAELSSGAEPTTLRARLTELLERHKAAAAGMRARHEAHRQRRHEARRRLAGEVAGEEERRAALHALGQESRADDEERRRLELAHRQEREVLKSALRELNARRARLEHLRAEHSRQLWQQMACAYVIPNARGEQRPLAALFAPEPPPGGAGDCAAPKLLGHAYRHGLRPLALAEFWWGAPPLTGERQAGQFYPACAGKCGAVLPYMLEGLSVDLGPLAAAAPRAAEELRLVYEDPWVLVVDKPCGLLSLPGRHSQLRDSVRVRLRQRFPELSEHLIMHPLEPELSGVLLVARDPETLAMLQRQFARREADKRYVALLEGHVTGDQGVVELPLRPSPGERSRHLVDPVHGRRAITEWRVTQRSGGRTRVVLFPRTGRTHQLRVHAAHPLGLGAPIVGDRLYGGEDTRLMLHAEALTFIHPRTGQRLELACPPSF